jgi:hypothetical protein
VHANARVSFRKKRSARITGVIIQNLTSICMMYIDIRCIEVQKVCGLLGLILLGQAYHGMVNVRSSTVH